MASMFTLNDVVLTIQQHFTVTACTDVTGFGLLGHLLEMTGKGKRGARIQFDSIPIFEGIRDLALAGVIPGGTLNNAEYVEPYIEWDTSLTRIDRILISDAQTSGGLLFTIPSSEEESLKTYCLENHISLFPIGYITEEKRIKVL